MPAHKKPLQAQALSHGVIVVSIGRGRVESAIAVPSIYLMKKKSCVIVLAVVRFLTGNRAENQ